MNPYNNMEARLVTGVRVRNPRPTEEVFTDVLNGLPMMAMGHSAFPCAADYLLGRGFQQEHVFENVAKPMLQRFINGQDDVTIIAFGQRMSGKTYTMFGPAAEVTESAVYYGIYPRLATYLFSLYDSFMFFGPEAQVRVFVAFFELENSHIKDLLSNHFVPTEAEASVLATGLSRELLSTLTYEMCTSARHMVQWLNVALHNRQTRPAHMFAHVLLHQPVLAEGGHYVQVKTSALLADIGNCLIEYPHMTNINHNPMLYREDHCVLQYLAATLGERILVPQLARPDGFLLQLLKQSFNGERAILALCCVSPSFADTTETTEYLTTLVKIFSMRHNPYFQQYPENTRTTETNDANKVIETSDANSLLSEAESLFSKLSLSQSISDEDRQQFRHWLTMKKECEESVNAQSHGQLECIEEVTESEEEIASSDEKMSESPDSLDSSLPESDQEEGESKVCHLSDDNFFSSLDNMCLQFNTLVDKFVDSFKAKASLSPAKERKRAYSAVRRGGMPELPPVKEFKAEDDALPRPFKRYSKDELDKPETDKDGRNKHAFNVLYGPQENHNEGDERQNLGGCIRRPPRNRDSNKKDKREREDKSREREREAKEEGRRRPDSPAEEDAEAAQSNRTCQPNENDPDKEEYISWSMLDPGIFSERDIHNWLERQENDMRLIRSVLRSCIEQEQEYEELKPLDIERNKQLLYAVLGIEPLIDLMKDNLTFDAADAEAQYCGLNHVIRLHRAMRDEFVREKLKLDACVKNQTATEQEVRDYIMADEMIDSLDSCIEFLNNIIISGKPAEQKLPKSDVCANVMKKLSGLTSLEMKNLIFKYFIKVVDLRENSKTMEQSIMETEQKLELANARILALTRMIQNMRNQQAHLVAKFNGNASEDTEEQQGAVGGASPLPTSPLALTEGSNTRTRRIPAIPRQNFRQLQVRQDEEVSTTVEKSSKKIVIRTTKRQK